MFGLADLLLIYALFKVSFGTARIRVANGEITASKRILGIGTTQRFSVSDVDAIVAVTSGQQSGTQGQMTYAVRLRTKNGRRVALADEVASRQEARWVVSQIESLAGLKIDTHVEVDSLYGPPPQPDQPLFNPSQPGSLGPAGLRLRWQQSRPQSRASTIAPIAIFLLFVGGMFAWQVWRFSTFKAAASAARANKVHANGSREATTANAGAPHRVYAAPMNSADVERVLALPAQAQAEELLERAIGHDERARELFDQQVETWVGHIRLTDHLKQLEQRSEFSSDLRVRYANADINLTLDGWQKNEQAAGMLIDRARTDLQYRPAAVYFLGMLAGRGVDYERIYPVLLDYAKHDPDAGVRQWAVEGMRYLAKDEALTNCSNRSLKTLPTTSASARAAIYPIAEISRARNGCAWCRNSWILIADTNTNRADAHLVLHGAARNYRCARS